jgi:hypothetical protein
MLRTLRGNVSGGNPQPRLSQDLRGLLGPAQLLHTLQVWVHPVDGHAYSIARNSLFTLQNIENDGRAMHARLSLGGLKAGVSRGEFG